MKLLTFTAIKTPKKQKTKAGAYQKEIKTFLLVQNPPPPVVFFFFFFFFLIGRQKREREREKKKNQKRNIIKKRTKREQRCLFLFFCESSKFEPCRYLPFYECARAKLPVSATPPIFPLSLSGHCIWEGKGWGGGEGGKGRKERDRWAKYSPPPSSLFDLFYFFF